MLHEAFDLIKSLVENANLISCKSDVIYNRDNYLTYDGLRRCNFHFLHKYQRLPLQSKYIFLINQAITTYRASPLASFPSLDQENDPRFLLRVQKGSLAVCPSTRHLGKLPRSPDAGQLACFLPCTCKYEKQTLHYK